MRLSTRSPVSGRRGANETPYDSDYRALAELHEFVGTVPGLAVLVLQHKSKGWFRRSDRPDFRNAWRAWRGGHVDGAHRVGPGPKLHVRDRDVEETNFAVRFNKQTCRWSLIGNAEVVHLSETRKKIADTLMSCKSGRMTPAELATATGLTRAVIDKRLADMVEEGQAIKLARAAYAHPDRVSNSPIHPPSV